MFSEKNQRQKCTYYIVTFLQISKVIQITMLEKIIEVTLGGLKEHMSEFSGMIEILYILILVM